jgi:hypothetical protein
MEAATLTRPEPANTLIAQPAPDKRRAVRA